MENNYFQAPGRSTAHFPGIKITHRCSNASAGMRFLLLLSLFLCSRSFAQRDSVFRIYFRYDQYTPASETNPFLRLDTNRWQPGVTLIGKTDTTGDVTYNRYLADFRIKAVEKWLKKQPYFQVAQSVIKGESEPAANYIAARERCVIVIVHPKNTAPGNNLTTSFPDPIAQDQPAIREPRDFDPNDSLITKGDVLVLKNILFELNETILLSESYPELDQLLRMMRTHPTMRIHIRGNVCCAPAMDLSVRRAQKIYSYLIRNGISDDRLTYKGYSNKLPDLRYKDDLFDSRHRRVEIEVVSE